MDANLQDVGGRNQMGSGFSRHPRIKFHLSVQIPTLQCKIGPPFSEFTTRLALESAFPAYAFIRGKTSSTSKRNDVVSGNPSFMNWKETTPRSINGLSFSRICLGVGKYPTKWTDLARKRGTLPSILDTGTNFSRKAAPHLASFIDVL